MRNGAPTAAVTIPTWSSAGRTTTRPTTVLRLPDTPTEQRTRRYHNPVNRDRKFNPRRVTELATLNYL